jgi:guanine deaminase
MNAAVANLKVFEMCFMIELFRTKIMDSLNIKRQIDLLLQKMPFFMELSEKFIRAAIAMAVAGNTPFGCVIVLNDIIVASAFNTVKVDNDPTAHAEINAIRQLPAELKLQTGKMTLYTTCEPCPMCMGAVLFAGIGKVVFGASIEDISRFYKQIHISCKEMAERGFGNVEITGSYMKTECLELFKQK